MIPGSAREKPASVWPSTAGKGLLLRSVHRQQRLQGVQRLADAFQESTTEEVPSFDDELSTCATSSGSIEQDIIDAHQPPPSTEAEVVADDTDDDEEEAEITAAAGPSSRQILKQFRAILASANVSAEVLHHVRRAEQLLTEDILRSKRATRQLTISEMFGQRQ